jgi:hypothetical protein
MLDPFVTTSNGNSERHSLPVSAFVGDHVHGSEEFVAMYCDRDMHVHSSVFSVMASSAADHEHTTAELESDPAVVVVVAVVAFPRLSSFVRMSFIVMDSVPSL